MRNDFTRINFGWWNYSVEMQPDMFEYGTSRALAWDCPGTMISNFENFANNPRTDDNFEVLRRWEDVRLNNRLSDVQKEVLKDTTSEHILIINENNEYELCEYRQLEHAANSDDNIRAFIFKRKNKVYVVCWHTTGEAKLRIKLKNNTFIYENEIGKEKIEIVADSDYSIIPISNRRYFSSYLPEDYIIKAFDDSVVLCDDNH